MKRVYLVVLSMLMLSSCDTEEVIVVKEIEKEFKWMSHTGFEYEYAVQLNSFATDERLLTLGINSMTVVLPDSVTDRFGANLTHYRIFNQMPLLSKLPIHDDYFISFSEKEPSRVKFTPTLNPGTSTPSGSTALAISVPELDSTFLRFDFVSLSSGESFAINSKGQALVPYLASRKGLTTGLKAILLDISANPVDIFSTTTIIDTLQTRQIDFNSTNDGFLAFVQSVNDNFYISPNYKETFRISSNGDVTRVLNDRLHAIFEEEQVLYAIGSMGTGYISTDAGLTWIENFKFPEAFTMLSYTGVNGKIIGYRNSQIFEITPSLAKIEFKELDNDGLAGKGITSISKLRNKVYVTSFGGVFYKELEDFFEEQEKE